ncbi:TetR/AcrR family transcriptional regulator [Allonocardiopsis opalescens]|nr:TetR family transcriptional regulator [Allonocardiopsis opalescens]
MRSSSDLTTRARIRNAALELFGIHGAGQVSIRAIADAAGVSPALVVHHFESKEGLRRACDAYVTGLIRGEEDDDPLQYPAELAALLRDSVPVRRYLARAFLDGSADAAAIFDGFVEVTQTWLEEGRHDGTVRPTDDPRARAALYVAWQLAPLVFDTHLARVLGLNDPYEPDSTLRIMRAGLHMLTHGVFADGHALAAWTTAQAEEDSA